MVAEADGIKFYREKTLHKYLEWKSQHKKVEESRKGKHCYTFNIPLIQKYDLLTEAIVGLEKNGCFDYTIDEIVGYVRIKYWHDNCILRWK